MRIRTRTSTTPRWKSAARVPYRCAGSAGSGVERSGPARSRQAIARVSEEARPDVREADELHDDAANPRRAAGGDARCTIGGSRWPRAGRRLLAELLEGWRVVVASVPMRRHFVPDEAYFSPKQKRLGWGTLYPPTILVRAMIGVERTFRSAVQPAYQRE